MLLGQVDGAAGHGHGVDGEGRAVGGGPGVAGPGLRRAVELDQDGDGRAVLRELLAELAAAQVGADALAGLGGAADRLHMAAQHAVLLARDGLDGEVDRGAHRDRRGALGRDVERRGQRVVGAGDPFDGGHVRAGGDDRADGGDHAGHPARGDRAHDGGGAALRTDLEHGGVGGDRLALLGEYGGDLARDGALEDVAALTVGEDARRVEGGGDGAVHRPDGGADHHGDGDDQYEPALGAGEAHRKIDVLR